MSTLSPGERRTLRAKAHHLHPVVSIGVHGLTPAVLHEIDVSLNAHELIKVRVWNDARAERDAMLARICDELGAAAVQHLGKLLVVWRPTPKKEEPPTPRRNAGTAKSAARKAPQARRPRSPLPRTPASPSRGPRGKVPAEGPATPGSRRRTPFAKTTGSAERDDADPSRRRSRSSAAKAGTPRSSRRSTAKGPFKPAVAAATPHGKSRSSSVGAAGARRRRRKAG